MILLKWPFLRLYKHFACFSMRPPKRIKMVLKRRVLSAIVHFFNALKKVGYDTGFTFEHGSAWSPFLKKWTKGKMSLVKNDPSTALSFFFFFERVHEVSRSAV